MRAFGTVMPSQAKQDEGKDIWVARFFFEKQYVARKFNSYEEAEAYRQKVEAARRANDFDFLYAEIEAKKREIKARKAENERKDKDEGTIQIRLGSTKRVTRTYQENTKASGTLHSQVALPYDYKT